MATLNELKNDFKCRMKLYADAIKYIEACTQLAIDKVEKAKTEEGVISMVKDWSNIIINMNKNIEKVDKLAWKQN